MAYERVVWGTHEEYMEDCRRVCAEYGVDYDERTYKGVGRVVMAEEVTDERAD